MTENVHNFDVVIDISGVAEFYVNSYDVSTCFFNFFVTGSTGKTHPYLISSKFT